jgi:hypothetical protein
MLSRSQILDWFEKDAMKEMIEYYDKHPISEEQHK